MVDDDESNNYEQLALLQRQILINQGRSKISGCLAKCPVCGGGIESGFKKCRHCRADLIWYNGIPGEPGSEEEIRKIFKSGVARAEQEKLEYKIRVAILVFIFITISAFMLLWVMLSR